MRIFAVGLAIGALLQSCQSQASEFFSVGLGRNFMAHENFERFAKIGYKTVGEVQFKADGGLWLDYSDPVPITYWGSVSGGYELQTTNGAYVSWFFGPAAISHTDWRLGSWYQFHLDFGAGVKMKDGKAFGVYFEHFSNAGIVQPNIGRDIFALEVQF